MAFDYGQFRDSAAIDYQAVSVNHRALITRTLTKYPLDYALYRELLQNSADARATSATIQFFPERPGPVPGPVLHTVAVNKLVFSNNGTEFAEDDWGRLCEIARGNPNEAKIGAFGVGFYSVFELTDEPLVHSGDTVMSFHFEGDQLKFSRRKAPFLKGTLVDIPFREPGKLPDLIKFVAFLSQSIMLVNIHYVELKLADKLLYSLNKVESPPAPIALPKGLDPYSPTRILKLATMSSVGSKVTIKYLNATQTPHASFKSATGLLNFGRNLVSSLVTGTGDPEEYTEVVCFLRRIDAEIDVHVSSAFSKNMKQTVMKPPPRTSYISVLSYSQDEQANSDTKASLSNYIFPKDFNDAKIFIGFPTKQSTGLKSHLAMSQLIPTMERTFVDMSNAFVKDWNSQMLYMAGIVARCVYENELKTASKCDDIEKQTAMANFTMGRFELGPSAPDKIIGQWITSGFWNCSKSLLVPTQKGIMPSEKARLAGSVPKSILREIPVISVGTGGSDDFLEQAKELGYLHEPTTADIVQDLESAPIDSAVFRQLITWLYEGKRPKDMMRRILHASVVATTSAEGDTLTIPLGNVTHYQNKSMVEEGLPIPPTAVPAFMLTGLSLDGVEHLGWKELDLVTWASFLVSDLSRTPVTRNVTLNQDLAVRVLDTLGRGWQRLTDPMKSELQHILAPVNCIPTQLGMKQPGESYLAKIDLFPNLPVISEDVTASKGFLFGINLRQSIDMAFVLKVLHNGGGNLSWSNGDLTKYLATNRGSLHKSDWQVLQSGAFFTSRSNDRQVLKTLYAPDPALVRLQLPTLEWDGTWNPVSPEASLLFKLGLRRGPSSDALFGRAVELNLIPTALSYYLDNYELMRYDSVELSKLPLSIIPCNGTYFRPAECFLGKGASYFGFPIVDSKYQAFAQRLGVRDGPEIKMLLNKLAANPPRNFADGDDVFTYLSQRLSEFSSTELSFCSTLKFIPIRSQGKFSWVKPGSVFLHGTNESNELDGLFMTISPTQTSLPFLLKVGVRHSPSIVEIAEEVAKEPQRVYNTVQSVANYVELLKKFEEYWRQLSSRPSLVSSLTKAGFVPGVKYDTKGEKNVTLCRPDELVVVDNIIVYNQFKNLIDTVPQENLLEELCLRLGAKYLSQLLLEKVNFGNILTEQNKSTDELRERIRERVALFLESTSKPGKISVKDARKIDIVLTSSIELHRKLPHTPVVKVETTAYGSPVSSWKIYVTPKFEWFDLAEALAKVLVKRPDPESVIVLELQLSSSLEQLQRKGYNVSRLLSKAREKEQQSLKFVAQPEVATQTQAIVSPTRPNSTNVQPPNGTQGVPTRQSLPPPAKASLPTPAKAPLSSPAKAPVSSPAKAPVSSPAKVPVSSSPGSGSAPQRSLSDHPVVGKPPLNPESPVSLPSGVSRPSPAQQPTQRPSATSAVPPSKSLWSGLGSRLTSSIPGYSKPTSKTTTVQQQVTTGQGSPMDDTSLTEKLQKGLESLRPHTYSRLQGYVPGSHSEPEPVVPVSCNKDKIQDLTYACTLDTGIKLYKPRGFGEFNSEQIESAVAFSNVLKTLAGVYGFPFEVCAIFADDLSTIAFNSNSSLFFNLAVFERQRSLSFDVQLDYWFPVAAHELAHNIVGPHGERHSFFSESYVQQFLRRLRMASRPTGG